MGQNAVIELITIALSVVLIILPIVVAVAWLTWAERKIIAAMQLRKGPNVVGVWGLLQPIADGLKLLAKETVIPIRAEKVAFFAAPILTFGLALIAWAVIPVGGKQVLADINMGVLYIFAISSLGIYGIIIAGWASNSRYGFLGALRSAAQMISYEISIGLVLLAVILPTGSMNLTAIVEAQRQLWYVVPLFPMFVVFFISALAETNRAPFDLPEAEAELVSGYNVEYSSMGFALFFLGEYANMILMSALAVVFFLGGWYAPFDMPFGIELPPQFWFCLKVGLLLFVFIWVRATLPRYRYDQLMRLGWKVFLPLCFFWLVASATVLFWWERI